MQDGEEIRYPELSVVGEPVKMRNAGHTVDHRQNSKICPLRRVTFFSRSDKVRNFLSPVLLASPQRAL